MGFVANFICFPKCKNFENQLRFEKFTESLMVGTFMRHSVVVVLVLSQIVVATLSKIGNTDKLHELP